MKIKVSPDLCCGIKLCLKAAPRVYKVDALGYNASDGQHVEPDQEDAARRGAEVCPEGAIALVDD